MLGRRFDEAVSYASIVHGDHIRKSTGTGPAVPYMAHLLGVAALVLEDGGGEDEATAAMLHDAVEDRGGAARLEDIRRRFGERVAAIVRGCSDAIREPGVEKEDWWVRKCAHLEHLAHADGDIAGPLLRVSMADKLSNLRATVRDARARGARVLGRVPAGCGRPALVLRPHDRRLPRALPGQPDAARAGGAAGPARGAPGSGRSPSRRALPRRALPARRRVRSDAGAT
jgi:HD domain